MIPSAVLLLFGAMARLYCRRKIGAVTPPSPPVSASLGSTRLPWRLLPPSPCALIRSHHHLAVFPEAVLAFFQGGTEILGIQEKGMRRRQALLSNINKRFVGDSALWSYVRSRLEVNAVTLCSPLPALRA